MSYSDYFYGPEYNDYLADIDSQDEPEPWTLEDIDELDILGMAEHEGRPHDQV